MKSGPSRLCSGIISPCWPRVPLAFALINKLMIVEEQHTKQSNKQRVS